MLLFFKDCFEQIFETEKNTLEVHKNFHTYLLNKFKINENLCNRSYFTENRTFIFSIYN